MVLRNLVAADSHTASTVPVALAVSKIQDLIAAAPQTSPDGKGHAAELAEPRLGVAGVSFDPAQAVALNLDQLLRELTRTVADPCCRKRGQGCRGNWISFLDWVNVCARPFYFLDHPRH